ncbi:MAG TPA: flagellin FliC, partial [Solirubrobacteraceae bacterium]|nr:flagellin FliC [Solirubrobacteraceae bacterium]
MSLRINTNVDAQAAHRYLSTTSDAVSKSMERLSSGLRINKAADDA